MRPKSVSLTIEKNVLYWRNTSFSISVDEAKALAEEVRTLVKTPGVTGMLVDNRGVAGAWPAEVNPVWGDLMGYLTKTIQKCATIASTVVAMQINRISKETGTLDKIQAFTEPQEALDFMGVKNLVSMKP